VFAKKVNFPELAYPANYFLGRQPACDLVANPTVVYLYLLIDLQFTFSVS